MQLEATSSGRSEERKPDAAVDHRPSPGPAPAERFDLRLAVPADAGALALVRHAVGGIAVGLGLGPTAVADVRLALTEVCSAVIRRTGAASPLEIIADLHDDALRVIVRDRGRHQAAGPGEALPLPLVAAITETVELRRARGGGTEVTMTFALARAGA